MTMPNQPHSTKVPQAIIQILKPKVFSHQPHTPDFLSSDFHLFPAMHVEFAVKHFYSNDKLQKAVHSYLQNLMVLTYYEGASSLGLEVGELARQTSEPGSNPNWNTTVHSVYETM